MFLLLLGMVPAPGAQIRKSVFVNNAMYKKSVKLY